MHILYSHNDTPVRCTVWKTPETVGTAWRCSRGKSELHRWCWRRCRGWPTATPKFTRNSPKYENDLKKNFSSIFNLSLLFLYYAYYMQKIYLLLQ